MAAAFTAADIPALYYEMERTGDDASLIALMCRWLATRPAEDLIDLAAFMATGNGKEA